MLCTSLRGGQNTGEDMDEHEALAARARCPGTSPEARRSALRSLFRSPRYNRCDGLDDYAEDFNRAGTDRGKHRV